MENVLWKVLAFLLCAFLLFLAPMMSLLDRQDDIAYSVVLAECNRFVDACRDTGYITPNMYSEFLDRLNATGNFYEIKISHIHRSVIPVYKEMGGVLTFTGEYDIIRRGTHEADILQVLFPPGSGLSALDKRRYYVMSAGDLLFVEVRNKGKTMAASLRDMILFSDSQTPTIFVRAGGMVRNEAD
jgi:hypothetical protein